MEKNGVMAITHLWARETESVRCGIVRMGGSVFEGGGERDRGRRSVDYSRLRQRSRTRTGESKWQQAERDVRALLDDLNCCCSQVAASERSLAGFASDGTQQGG